MATFKQTTVTTVEVEVRAQLPEDRDREEFREYLESIGNTVGEWDEEAGGWTLIFNTEQLES